MIKFSDGCLLSAVAAAQLQTVHVGLNEFSL